MKRVSLTIIFAVIQLQPQTKISKPVASKPDSLAPKEEQHCKKGYATLVCQLNRYEGKDKIGHFRFVGAPAGKSADEVLKIDLEHKMQIHTEVNQCDAAGNPVETTALQDSDTIEIFDQKSKKWVPLSANSKILPFPAQQTGELTAAEQKIITKCRKPKKVATASQKTSIQQARTAKGGLDTRLD